MPHETGLTTTPYPDRQGVAISTQSIPEENL